MSTVFGRWTIPFSVAEIEKHITQLDAAVPLLARGEPKDHLSQIRDGLALELERRKSTPQPFSPQWKQHANY